MQASLLRSTLVMGVCIALFGCGQQPVAEDASTTPPRVDRAFLDTVSGTLHIKLSEPPVPIREGLLNLKALPSAKLQTVRLELEMFVEEKFRPVTAAERLHIVVVGTPLRLVSDAGITTTHDAPNGRSFTLEELRAAVEEHERQTRGSTEWFGGIDVHHIYFEGLHPNDNGSYSIHWGS